MVETPPSWLNSEFLEKGLRSYGKDPNLIVISCNISRATLAGDHYGSEMYRATLKTNVNGKTEDISVVIKCKLRTGEISKMAEDVDLFLKEVKAFTDIHVHIRNMLKDAFAENFKPFAAKCIYTHIEPDAIILEDLKKTGFRLATVTHGLDLKHCLLVMKTIAQYHASAMVLRRQDPSLFETFKENCYSDSTRDSMSSILSTTVKTIREEVMKWPEYEDYSDVLNVLENDAIDYWINGMLRDEDGFNLLIHGDLWMNNMMFSYSEENEEVQNVRLVDFQLPYVTSPAVDLHYFMNSSASPEVLENHRHELIEEYYNMLCLTLSKLGQEDLQPTKQTLNSELENRKSFGVLAALTVRAFALADRSHVPDMDNIIRNNNAIYLSKSYKEAVKKLLPLYKKWGWLKF